MVRIDKEKSSQEVFDYEGDTENISNKHLRIIERAKKYVEDNFKEKITIDMVSEQVMLSPNYFCKIFKQCTGSTLNEYLTHVRIEKAKYLLKNTRLNISEVARETGYDDPYYFSFIFKKTVGLPPSEF